MKFSTLFLFLLFQNSFFDYKSDKFGPPFYQSDFIEVNKTFGKQRMALVLPIHVSLIDYPGINYQVKTNAPALSIAFGEIEKVDNSKGFGKYVIINHGNGIKARYYHLNETKVKVGDYVSRGEKIGVSGRTGLTTVNSIGLAIYSNDTKVDPDSFLTQDLKSKKNKN